MKLGTLSLRSCSLLLACGVAELLAVMLSGCAAKKVVNGMYCESMEQVDDPRGIRQLDTCHGNVCTGALLTACYEGARLVEENGRTRCTIDGKHCAVWAKRNYPCVTNEQTGGCK